MGWNENCPPLKKEGPDASIEHKHRSLAMRVSSAHKACRRRKKARNQSCPDNAMID